MNGILIGCAWLVASRKQGHLDRRPEAWLEVDLNLPNLLLLPCSTGRLSISARVSTSTSGRKSHLLHCAQDSLRSWWNTGVLVPEPLWGSLLLGSGRKPCLPRVQEFHCGCTSPRISKQSLPHHCFCISSGDCKTQTQGMAVRVFSIPAPLCLY